MPLLKKSSAGMVLAQPCFGFRYTHDVLDCGEVVAEATEVEVVEDDVWHAFVCWFGRNPKTGKADRAIEPATMDYFILRGPKHDSEIALVSKRRPVHITGQPRATRQAIAYWRSLFPQIVAW